MSGHSQDLENVISGKHGENLYFFTILKHGNIGSDLKWAFLGS